MGGYSLKGMTMYGIVLWSGNEGRKAVIWCEDHGDLAFFETVADPVDGPRLEAGDMVRFRSEAGRRMRLAVDLERVADQRFPEVVDTLKGKSNACGAAIIEFPVMLRNKFAAF